MQEKNVIFITKCYYITVIKLLFPLINKQRAKQQYLIHLERQ